MADFSIIMAFFDGDNSFRRRNLSSVLDRCVAMFPDNEIVVAEQGDSYVSGTIQGHGDNVRRLRVDAGKVFHKTRLLNEAVKSAKSDNIVMVDADSYLSEDAARSVVSGVDDIVSGKYGILYPYGSVDYLTEAQTKVLLSGDTINSRFCDHGVIMSRQTGLCNMFTKATWEKVAGFDEFFKSWGAEDDAFMFKIRRIVGPVGRTEGNIYHLFHPHVDTNVYRKSYTYMMNRKACALVRRMSDSDMNDYVSRKVSMDLLMEKYEKMHRLDCELHWQCTPGNSLNIDTTIYDFGTDPKMTFTLLFDVMLAEDGPEYTLEFISETRGQLSDLSDEQNAELDAIVERIKGMP